MVGNKKVSNLLGNIKLSPIKDILISDIDLDSDNPRIKGKFTLTTGKKFQPYHNLPY